jgi:hypothetical protein
MAEQQKTTDVSAATGTAKAGAGFVAKKMRTRAIGQVVGSIAPGVGNAVAYAATETAIKAKQLIGKAGRAVGLFGRDMKDTGRRFLVFGGALIGASMISIAITIGAVFLIGVPLVAFTMFVINSGSYVVPYQSSGTGSGGDPGFTPINVGASCLIPDGKVLWGSYGGPFSEIGHGENGYWSSPSVNASCTAYPIPEGTGCYYKQRGDACERLKPGMSCPYYGYAADFIYPNIQRNGQAVFYPYINGETVNWVLGDCRNATSSVCMLKASQGGKAYEMRVIHLARRPTGGKSGDQLGQIYVLIGTPHVHVELRVDGEWVPPEFMCTGDTAGGVPDGGTGPAPSCASIDGECVSTPNCGRLERSQLNGTCSSGDPSLLCCSSPADTPTTCVANGGTCYSTAVLGVIKPGAVACEQVGWQSVQGSCNTGAVCCKSTP